jgi:hypothetical protein
MDEGVLTNLSPHTRAHIYIHTDRQTDRQTDTHTHTHTYIYIHTHAYIRSRKTHQYLNNECRKVLSLLPDTLSEKLLTKKNERKFAM